jgi:serine/threonine-protein kinase HipA
MGETSQARFKPLAIAQVAEMLANVQDNPLGNKPVGGKTSLAGVQDKIVLASTPDGWGRVVDGYPSTHILKPESSTYPTTIYDEEFGARLARAVGLSTYQTWIEEFDAVRAVVIERYDRSPRAPHGRIHQEDFNQALGAAGDQKHQRYGGRVSLARIAKVLSEIGSHDGLDRLLCSLVLSVAVGNLDMHAKNVSLLHHHDGTVTLAPAYDVVPQTHISNDGEMALAVNNEYHHRKITRAHLVAEARGWGHPAAEHTVDETLAIVLDAVTNETPHPHAHPNLVDDITRFTRNLMAGRAAGDD